MKKIILPLMAVAFLASCGGGQQEETTTETLPGVKEESCTYSYNAESTEVLWVAYKYTQKTGVKGVFDDVKVDGVVEASHPADVIANASFSINTASVNSGDPTRDPKIKDSFFGTMTGGEVLTGKVVSVAGDDTKGSVEFSLIMNGVDHPIKGEYTVVDNKMEVSAEITMADWSATDAIAALNKVCEDLHKGADGQSILWPEISLYISTTLNKTCN